MNLTYSIRPERRGKIAVAVSDGNGPVLLVVRGSSANVRHALPSQTRELRRELAKARPVRVRPLDMPIAIDVAKSSITLVGDGAATELTLPQARKLAAYLTSLSADAEARAQ